MNQIVEKFYAILDKSIQNNNFSLDDLDKEFYDDSGYKFMNIDTIN